MTPCPGDLLTDADEPLRNDDPRLTRAWHPLLPAAHADGATATLLGRDWRVTRGPDGWASEPPAWGVAERAGLVWLAPEEPLVDLPDAPEGRDPAFAVTVIERPTHICAGVLVDNFLDVAHFSYLHPTTFQIGMPVTTEDYRLDHGEWTVALRHATRLHTTADETGSGAERVATYTFTPPYTAHLQMDYPEQTHRSAATLTCRPIDDGRTQVYVAVTWPADDPAGLAEQVDLSLAVLDEDLRMLDLLADARLPLAIGAELHTRADRASVEMRRIMVRFLAALEGES